MKKQQPDLSRRSLLKTLTVGSAATAVVAASGISVAHAKEGNAVAKQNKDGYHETAHIRAYYNSLRS